MVQVDFRKSIPPSIREKAIHACKEHDAKRLHFRKMECGKYTALSIGYKYRVVFVNGEYHCMTHEDYNGLVKKKRL